MEAQTRDLMHTLIEEATAWNMEDTIPRSACIKLSNDITRYT